MSLDKLKQILESLNLKELKEAKSLINNYYKKVKKSKSSKQLIDAYINKYGIYFRLEKVFCNKSNCQKCNGQDKEGHGPYWYSYKNGKREYIGKKDKNYLDKINNKPKFMVKNQDKHLPYKR
ncbi:hypothetical protein BX659_1515 [Orenia metallireducens]|jgi:hypothetical protein|uniref:DUF6788 domain-containing protein n=1 Tax=Orenia metallireducens TaxID=1413210 RepID=A0A285IKB5_9FIRM|nr:hypothetical protein [Orenia metallireducens]PRX17486.1 hypothetical protein BX659_1515 [Orenia metallireducens]SNY47431.1 hypothetical protein SAMN06265827_1515 [Orenia metallireducens]